MRDTCRFRKLKIVKKYVGERIFTVLFEMSFFSIDSTVPPWEYYELMQCMRKNVFGRFFS